MSEDPAPTETDRSLPASTGPQVLPPAVEASGFQVKRHLCVARGAGNFGCAAHVWVTSHSTETNISSREYLFYSRQISSQSAPEPELRPSTRDRFQEMLNARRLAVGDYHFHAFGKQISALLGDEAELLEAGVRPSMVAFEGLLQFVRWNPDLKHPSLSVDQCGRFVASWSPRARSTLAITFEGVANARWIGIERIEGKSVRSSGNLDRLKLEAVDNRFLGWALL